MNYDVTELIRGTGYRELPDLNPARYIVFGGLFLKVEGWQRKPERRWIPQVDRVGALLALGALVTAVWAFKELWEDLAR